MSEEKKTITVLRDSYDARKREEKLEQAQQDASVFDTFAFDMSAFDLSDFGDVKFSDSEIGTHFYDRTEESEEEEKKAKDKKQAFADWFNDDLYEEEDDDASEAVFSKAASADDEFPESKFLENDKPVKGKTKKRKEPDESFDEKYDDRFDEFLGDEEDWDNSFLEDRPKKKLKKNSDKKAEKKSEKRSEKKVNKASSEKTSHRNAGFDDWDFFTGPMEVVKPLSINGVEVVAEGTKKAVEAGAVVAAEGTKKVAESSVIVAADEVKGAADNGYGKNTVEEQDFNTMNLFPDGFILFDELEKVNEAKAKETSAEKTMKNASRRDSVESQPEVVVVERTKEPEVVEVVSEQIQTSEEVVKPETEFPEDFEIVSEIAELVETKAEDTNADEIDAEDTYAAAYVSSEKNVDAMLAEYDLIGEEDNYPPGHSAKKKASDNIDGAKKTSSGNKSAKASAGSKSSGKSGKSGKKAAKQEPLTAGEKFKRFIGELTAMDYIVALMAVVVIVAAVITIKFVGAAKAVDNQIESFKEIGVQIGEFGIIGEDVLVEMGAFSPVVEEETTEEYVVTEYEENEEVEASQIEVKLVLNSVVKDLKIKFTNAKTNKLIAGVPFEVEIVDANKKTFTRTDDDKDGIIYLEKMTPGKTKITVKELTDANDKKKYLVASASDTVKVKENIDYKKIEVADEVKTEDQVNAKAEDTAQALATEATLTDTVEWVESTKTPNGTKTDYEEVTATEIAVPATVSKVDIFNEYYYRLLDWKNMSFIGDVHATEGEIEIPVDDPTPTPDTPTPTETVNPDVTSEPTPTPTEAIEVPSDNPTVTVAPTEAPAVTPTPTTAPNYDKTAVLKTTSGDVLYVKENDSYRQATAADYYSGKVSKFYKQVTKSTDFLYTGWQEIDGHTYFFDKNGNKVTGEQVIQGAKYVFDSTGALQKGSGSMGIDVSKWNGTIDWKAVKNSGVSYVIIRCGYRGSTTGALIEDPKFRENIKGATSVGLKVGVYFFSQAVNEVEAVEEASMAISLMSGYRISYPVFLDVEDSKGRGDVIDAATRTKVINAFCQTVRNSGYTAGVYANKSWLETKFKPSALSGCKIWLAQYNTAPTYGGKYDMWQYSSKGSVAGIKGNVDMNLSYLGY